MVSFLVLRLHDELMYLVTDIALVQEVASMGIFPYRLTPVIFGSQNKTWETVKGVTL